MTRAGGQEEINSDSVGSQHPPLGLLQPWGHTGTAVGKGTLQHSRERAGWDSPVFWLRNRSTLCQHLPDILRPAVLYQVFICRNKTIREKAQELVDNQSNDLSSRNPLLRLSHCSTTQQAVTLCLPAPGTPAEPPQCPEIFNQKRVSSKSRTITLAMRAGTGSGNPWRGEKLGWTVKWRAGLQKDLKHKPVVFSRQRVGDNLVFTCI